MKATTHIFASGKGVCLGTKTLSELDEAGREFVEILKNLGYSAHFTGFEVKNFVGSGYLGGEIDLLKFSDTLKGAWYEAELFPGLQYVHKNKSMIIFYSGKIIVTGAKRLEEIDEVYADMLNIVKSKSFLK